MENLKRMAIFYHVVEAGGFTAAARRIGVAKSAVSRHIVALEHDMGVRLLNRTTRQMSLTEAGEIYYQSCAKIVNEAENASRKISTSTGQLTGSLRIACPVALGNSSIAPLVKTFSEQHPELKIELLVSDEFINLIDEGVDIAIRVGWLTDSNLIARKITDSRRVLCASPEYIKKTQEPKSITQLLKHEWVIYTLLQTPNRQTIKKQGEQKTINIKGRFKTNNILTLRSLLLEGAGLGVLSEFLVSEDIKQGRLIKVLDDYDFGNAGVYVVYPDRMYKQTKVQLFVDFIDKFLLLE